MIAEVQRGLETEYGISPESAVIVSGDNTATVQLQDLDGDGARESAVTFLRVPGVERSLKICIFSQLGEDYRLTGLVEGDGSSIYSVDYVELNGSGKKELVVNWQLSNGVYQLGVYTLDELSPLEGENDSLSVVLDEEARAQRLATELLLVSCSAVTDSSGTSSGYRLVDIDQDTSMEIAVARVDSAGWAVRSRYTAGRTAPSGRPPPGWSSPRASPPSTRSGPTTSQASCIPRRCT